MSYRAFVGCVFMVICTAGLFVGLMTIPVTTLTDKSCVAFLLTLILSGAILATHESRKP